MTAVHYDPADKYEVRVDDVEYRRDGEDYWLVRLYRPLGPGPFPVLLDVHGGQWSMGDRTQNELVDSEMAASGLLVAAVDFRLGPQHPYPAQVQDVNYAIRWLKLHAFDFNGRAERLGGLGTSSGGHIVTLCAMRPRDPRYTAVPFTEDPEVDASLAFVLALWPVLDPYARYLYGKQIDRKDLIRTAEGFFLTEQAMQEGNPQAILERGESVEMPPLLLVQGFPDDNIPKAIPERFFAAYQAAGGPIELEWFPGSPHGFARKPGAATDRALDVMKAFVSRQLSVVGAAL